MASRLYRTTRLLYLCVCQALDRLRLGTLGTPTLAVLIASTVTGLILLDARPTQTRGPRRLSGARRGDCRESLCQALALGCEHLFDRQKAQSLGLPDHRAAVVFG